MGCDFPWGIAIRWSELQSGCNKAHGNYYIDGGIAMGGWVIVLSETCRWHMNNDAVVLFECSRPCRTKQITGTKCGIVANQHSIGVD